jgi:hypothetical protein
MKRFYSIIISVLIMQLALGQEGAPFGTSKHLYLRGGSILIGNNILGNHFMEPLMDAAVTNDAIKMKYIDIDDDKRTFSSSEATISGAMDHPKIAYAVLYWSALYPYKTGVLRRLGDKMVYKGLDERDAEINTVLLKTPDDEYRIIKGKTIFDGYEKDAFSASAPYVCYADVTPLLQSLPQINGNYTVANVKATEGEIFGGSAAGWLLYIVYEDPSASPKFFNTYNGLVGIGKAPTEIVFNGFESKKDETTKVAIALGALEGDRKLKKDEVSVFNREKEKYKALGNSERKKNNFFNSSITLGDSEFTNRNPNSSNTLGFDVLKMELPNEKNEIIDTTTTEAKFRFQSKADHYYLFFMAFETEISESFFENMTKPDTQENAAIDPKTKSTNPVPQPKVKPKPKDPGTTAAPKPVVQKEKKKGKTKTKEKPMLQSLSIPDLEKGYYLVTNTFLVPENAIEWKDVLTKKGYAPNIFVNPKKQTALCLCL